MNRDATDDLPILTDVVELHATGSFPRPDHIEDSAHPYASGLLSEDDVSALQAALAKLIDEARAAGIIVTTANVDLPESEAQYKANGFGYVGQKLYPSGRMLGNAAVDICSLKPGDKAMVWGLLGQQGRKLARDLHRVVCAPQETYRVRRLVVRSELVAKQIAHNALSGQDDPAVLLQLMGETDRLLGRVGEFRVRETPSVRPAGTDID